MPFLHYDVTKNKACLTEAGRRPAVDNVFGKEWCLNLWRHEESHVGEQEDTHLDSSAIAEEVDRTYRCWFTWINVRIQLTSSLFYFVLQPVDLLDEEPDMIMIKEETYEDCSGKNNHEEDESSSLRGLWREWTVAINSLLYSYVLMSFVELQDLQWPVMKDVSPKALKILSHTRYLQMTKSNRTCTRPQLKSKLLMERSLHMETVQQSNLSIVHTTTQVLQKRKGLSVYSVKEASTN